MELNLTKILERLQQGGDTQDEDVNTWRKLLYQTVGEILGRDLDSEVSPSVQKCCTVCLQFVAHTITTTPQVFVRLSPTYTEDTPSLTQPKASEESRENQQCYGVSCWVVRHLLCLLASPQGAPLHSQARGVLVALLRMSRTKDLSTFRRLVADTVATLADLVQFEDKFYEDDAEDDYQPMLHRFVAPQGPDSSGDALPSDKAVKLCDTDMIQELQVNLCQVLIHIAMDMCQFARDVCYNNSPTTMSDLSDPGTPSRDLWTTLGRQMEFGDMPLKVVSQDLCRLLMEHGGLPALPVLTYILDCVGAMAAVLCAPDKDFSAVVQKCVETSYVALVRQLHETSKGDVCLLATSQHVGPTLVEALTTQLTRHGTGGLASVEGRQQLCGVLASLLGATPPSGLWRHRGRALGRVLLAEIGTQLNTEYMVSLLRQIVVMDAQDTGSKPEPLTVNTAVASVSASYVSSGQFEGKSFVCILAETLTNMCDESSSAGLMERLEATSMAIETLCYLIAKCQDSQQDTKPDSNKKNAVPSYLRDLLHSSRLRAVCALWQKFVQAVCGASNSLTQEQVCAGYTAVVRAMGALLVLQDLLPLDRDLLHSWAWLLSLAWLATEMSWDDMKLVEKSRELVALSSKFAEELAGDVRGECCRVLCLFPKEVAHKWRSRVLSMALSDASPDTRAGAVRGFPYFLHHCGPNANHLVHTPLLTCVRLGEDRDHAVQQAVAEITGPLACVVARTGRLCRELPAASAPLYQCTQVRCSECDSAPPTAAAAAGSPPQEAGCARLVDPSMFAPFMELLHCPDNSVKLAMIGGLRQLFGHVGALSGNAATSKMVKGALGLMLMDSHGVRIAFSGAVRHVLGVRKQHESSSHNNIDNILVSHLKEAARVAKHSRDVSLMETILLSVGQIAKVAEGNLLLVTIIILLESVCAPSCPLAAAVAHTQLRQMGEQREVNMRHLFLQFGRSITKVLVEQLGDPPTTDPIPTIANVATVFHFEDTKSFLKRTEHLLLPHLARKATPGASHLIKLIAKQVGDPNHKGPLARNIRHIYCHLVCSCQPGELARALTFLEGELEWDLGTLLRQGQNVDSELLLHLAAHRSQVLSGLKIWSSKLGLCPPNSQLSDQGMADLLQPKLLGILVHFDNHLNNGTVPLADKRAAYESVVSLMHLMGPAHITQVRMRLLTTLKIGLRFLREQGFPALCCQAWDVFVRTVETAALGPMLSQILVSLLPLLELLPRHVADTLAFLVVDNQRSLHQHFSELYFLPDAPELREVAAVLAKYQQGGGDLRTQLGHLLAGAAHESQEVRHLALSKLLLLLRRSHAALHQMVLGSESVDPAVSTMVTTLMAGCREADPALRSLYGECLGELGAIDPGRLDVMQSLQKLELHKFQATVTETNFAYELITELGRAFLRAEDRNTQDCVAFALQELIQLYAIADDDAHACSPGAQLWRRFPEDVQEILAPLKTSRYVLNIKYDWSKLTKPIYRSHKGSKFGSWVCTLTGYLSSKVTEARAKRVFESCWGVIRNDSQVALYLLPYVVVHSLLDGGAGAQAEVAAEVLAVLHRAQEPDTHAHTARTAAASSDLGHMAAQTVFSVLDHLHQWRQHRGMLLAAKAHSSRPTTTRGPAGVEAKVAEDTAHQCVDGFLAMIPQDTLAYASYSCGAYTRSLQHWEHFIKAAPGGSSSSSQNLDFLQKLYVALEEVDGVTGVTTVKVTPPSLAEQILAYESTGQLSDASVCYDQAIQQQPRDLGLHTGLLRCRLALGELNAALNQCNGMIAAHPSWASQLNTFRVEAAWKLGQWDDLRGYLRTEEHSRNWNVGVGKLLLAAQSADQAGFRRQLGLVRGEQMGPLSAASMEAGAYHRGYQYIARLHMLRDLELGTQALLHFRPGGGEEKAAPDPVALQEHWEARLQATQASHRVQEPLLSLRRRLLGLAGGDPRGVGRCWLQSAQVARQCGQTETAHAALLSAAQCGPMPQLAMERARWLWGRGHHDQAQACLERAVDDFYPDRAAFRAGGGDGEKEQERERRVTCAQVLLQLGRYCEETSSWESNRIVKHYKEVKELHGQWEEAYFCMAQYYDKLMGAPALGVQDQRGEFIIQVVSHFGSSLLHGNQYIYQSMPRMLTLWLDYGAEVADTSGPTRTESARQAMRAALAHLNRMMAQFCERLAPYQFLTALPQLISRLCHAQPEVFAQLREIVAQLLKSFPQQAMWLMMAVSNSTYTVRKKNCQDIFSKAKALNRDLAKFLQDATKLTDRLIELSNCTVEGANPLSISQHFKPLQRLVNDKNFSQILIPLQSIMNPVLPTVAVASGGTHDPFPGAQVFLRGLEDTVEVLPSLQRPKKLTLQGSDGKLYIVLCKPKDDLRKDARLMEFNGIINKCLRKDAESRRRGLHIRTYNVIPLNEECGMLEWVSNTTGLRHVLLSIYRQRGIYTSGNTLKQLQLAAGAPLDKKLGVYRNKLLPRHPAVFSEWFLTTFPDPTSWYSARLAYCRTIAVMSIAGYILGLGDRHGENILFDSTTGDCVHVDFNCLFNKGETFDYPEIVPFRLTHNMVEAMGPLGCEGVFRRSCEVTMRVMRDQMDPLMTVLKTFIYDPLVEWSKPARGRSTANDTGEIRNEKAQTHVKNIEARLKGILKNKTKPRGLPLSVEGHTNHLIKEATDENNLAQMYIGWAAYM